MEIEHGEMQKYHYQALSNPFYLIEGQMDVLREELMMNMPVYREPEPPMVIPQKIKVIHHYLKVNPSKKRYNSYEY
uniref:Uncharacterized protein n=1 Tax=viral metagenome TaxID=1070528 RepID=A0A6M3KUJ8_9ZZZZ